MNGYVLEVHKLWADNDKSLNIINCTNCKKNKTTPGESLVILHGDWRYLSWRGTVKVSKPVIYEDSEEERMRNTWILMFLNQKKKT